MPNQANLIILSFITKGDARSLPEGQGNCVLFFKRKGMEQVHSTFIEARLSGAEPKKKKSSDSDLSVRSITDVFKLNPKEDLRLVRKGKKLPFGKGTNIMAFLYRTSLKAENDEKEQGKLMQVFGDHTFVEVTLDVAFESPMVATAFHSVYLPPLINQKLLRVNSGMCKNYVEACREIIGCLHIAGTQDVALAAFRFYPSPADQPGWSKSRLIKARWWIYLSEVIAWQIKSSQPNAMSRLSWPLVSVLRWIYPYVERPEYRLDALKTELVRAIEREMHTILVTGAGQHAGRNAAYEAILGHASSLAGSVCSVLDVFTIGSHMSVMHSLLELAELVLFPKRSLRRDEGTPIPRQLRIVIAESRPSYEGVAVARRLYDYINDMMRNGKGKGKGKTSDFDLPYKWEDEDLDGSEDEEKELFGGIGKDLKDILGAAGADDFLKQRVDPSYQAHRAFQKRLASLFSTKSSDASKKSEPKIVIQICTDAAIGHLMRQRAKADEGSRPPVVILGAEGVLADGDVMAKVGSYNLARSAKDLKGTVLVPITEERVFGTKDDVQVDGAPEDLQGAWLANSNTTDRQVLLDFIKAGTDEKVVTLANPQWERVPAEMVGRYVTDTGPVELMEVRRFASERKEIEDRIWPDRD